MKYISFIRNGKPGFGALVNEDVIDLTNRIENTTTLRELLTLNLQSKAQQYVANAKPDFKYAEADLLPVVPNPNKIVCVGINYVAHAAEAGRTVGAYPVIFQRWADSLLAHGKPLLKPRVSEKFDYEGELAVVIGKAGGHVRPEDAMDYVAGYTCFNDASARDWQFHTHQYGMGKNFRSTGALGPWMVSADEIVDYREIGLKTILNGEQVQEGTLDQLAFDIPNLISYCSKAVDWQPGDILATGTPAGVGFKRNPPLLLKTGDIVEVVIDKIGVLRNPVNDE